MSPTTSGKHLLWSLSFSASLFLSKSKRKNHAAEAPEKTLTAKKKDYVWCLGKGSWTQTQNLLHSI